MQFHVYISLQMCLLFTYSHDNIIEKKLLVHVGLRGVSNLGFAYAICTFMNIRFRSSDFSSIRHVHFHCVKSHRSLCGSLSIN